MFEKLMKENRTFIVRLQTEIKSDWVAFCLLTLVLVCGATLGKPFHPTRVNEIRKNRLVFIHIFCSLQYEYYFSRFSGEQRQARGERGERGALVTRDGRGQKR